MWGPEGWLYGRHGILATSRVGLHLIPGAHYERMHGVDPEPHVYELMPQCADHLHWPGGACKDAREVAGKLDPAVDALGGGHSHCGGMIYLGDMFPESYRGKNFMSNTHGKRVNVDRLEYGPRGIADWTDKGECHGHDGVHRTSGRIYTVLHGSPRPPEPIDLHAKTDAELVALQLHRNDWFCRKAREILAERAAAPPSPGSAFGCLPRS
jgi:hypothetical protein